MLQESRRAHDLVLVGTTKAYPGTEPNIVMESISLIPADFMSVVGIELGRVCFRRRVTTLTLSVAR